MMGLRLNLTWKLLLISLVPFVVLGLTLQGINYYLVKTNFGKMTGQFEESLQQLNDQSASDLTSLSEQSAKELVYGIEIAIGNALQTGETTVFLNFAQK